MLVALHSAKGSPGVTSAALALAAVWPRPAVMVEADPSGGDVAYRCRASSGGQLASTPNLLGMVAAVRGDRQTNVREWTQSLACGVEVVLGIEVPAQSRGIGELWRRIAVTLASSEVDVIVDLGRSGQASPGMPLLVAADVRMPVVATTVESFMHTRAGLLDVVVAGARTTPLLIGMPRSADADARDLDGVLAHAGVTAENATWLALDHPGLQALESGNVAGRRGRSSPLTRSARGVAERLLSSTGIEVGP